MLRRGGGLRLVGASYGTRAGRTAPRAAELEMITRKRSLENDTVLHALDIVLLVVTQSLQH